MIFLLALMFEFDAVRMQILGKQDLPSLNETILIISAEEGRQSVMLETHERDGSALVTQATGLKETNLNKPIVQEIHSKPSIEILYSAHTVKSVVTPRNDAGNSMASPTEVQMIKVKQMWQAVNQIMKEVHKVLPSN